MVAIVADDTGKGARVYNNANISISNSTPTALTFNSEQYDQDTIHDTGSNTNRLTCKTAGKYMISGHVHWDTDDPAVGYRTITIRVNGTDTIAYEDRVPSSIVPRFSISTIYDLAVNDYVELVVFQSAGHALNVLYAAKSSPYFGMQRISG